MKLFLYTIFLFILTPCNGSKKMSSTSTVDTSNVVIVYQRSACYGNCPAFTLTINGSTNTMTYKGDSNVDKIGTYSKTISNEELKELVQAFEKSGFNKLNDSYLGPISDFPHQYITYTNNGETKTVNDGSGAPKELKSLESILEAIANSTGWKKTAEATNH